MLLSAKRKDDLILTHQLRRRSVIQIQKREWNTRIKKIVETCSKKKKKKCHKFAGRSEKMFQISEKRQNDVMKRVREGAEQKTLEEEI